MGGLTVTVSVENVERVSAALMEVRAGLMPTAIKTARRAVWRTAIPDTKKAIASGGGIGQRIWGANPVGLDKVVKAGKLIINDRFSQTSVVLVGIPALLERGGRIKPHFIRNGFGHPGRRIPHPGMALSAQNNAQEALERGESTITRDVNDAIAEMCRRHGF